MERKRWRERAKEKSLARPRADRLADGRKWGGGIHFGFFSPGENFLFCTRRQKARAMTNQLDPRVRSL